MLFRQDQLRKAFQKNHVLIRCPKLMLPKVLVSSVRFALGPVEPIFLRLSAQDEEAPCLTLVCHGAAATPH